MPSGRNFEGIGNLQALNLSDHIFKFVDEGKSFCPDWRFWLASCNVFSGSSWHMQDDAPNYGIRALTAFAEVIHGNTIVYFDTTATDAVSKLGYVPYAFVTLPSLVNVYFEQTLWPSQREGNLLKAWIRLLQSPSTTSTIRISFSQTPLSKL
jgi:hypothetical protein